MVRTYFFVDASQKVGVALDWVCVWISLGKEIQGVHNLVGADEELMIHVIKSLR